MVVMMVILPSSAVTAISNISLENCPQTCGSIIVPYPFGIGRLECAKNESFLLHCNQSGLFQKDNPIYNISLENGTLTVGIPAAYQCYNQTHPLGQRLILSVGGPYRISHTQNRLIGLGCDTVALMSDKEGRFGSGCLAVCNDRDDIEIDGSCSVFGCCQTTIPKHVHTLNVTAGSLYNHSYVLDFNPCSYAYVVANFFDISAINFFDYPEKTRTTLPMVFEWVVGEQHCQAREDPYGYSCGHNASCSYYFDTGGGSRCSCNRGFTGNPYLLNGCQDIDECKEPNKYHCQGTCRNTIGNYTCDCPLGMRGDGRKPDGCRGLRLTTIAAVIAAIIVVIVITLFILIICQKRKKEKYFRENGGMILKHQRIRIFSEAELIKATNNYDTSQFLGEGGFGSVYKAVVADNIEVAVKKAKEVDKARINQEFQHEIGIVSQVNHKNVVKLLGLCLETKVPLLVYEFISNGTLYHHIHDKRSHVLRSWKNRLRIATETALALDYLHSLADPPIIHGDVKSMNILLDDHYTAKVSDFGASVLISPNQTGIGSKIQGTLGYLDPEYLMTGNLTAKSDVYSFGVVLVELLTGEKPTSGVRDGEKRNIIQYFILSVEDHCIAQVLNFEPTNDGEMEEVEAVAELVKRCLNVSGLRRPTMKEVAEELARLKKLSDNFWAQGENEETEYLLGESSSYTNEFLNTKMEQMETYTVHTTFDIEQASTLGI
ncbi:hypothetical protein SLEP1_g11251 [Rubroshorea leprosula]|uniref:Protein kinase domain-containing protein n=1 Tax=Rubroshorea leprosula TaxID=152421 RepID=A0AAV5IKT1_9ROSI|nr:hypothetical protein SLEP1_g11251 [Rubroshorea leprosula]